MEVTKFYPDIQVLEANTDEDHVHLLVFIPPKMAVGRACSGRLAFRPTLSASREECSSREGS
jgi:REP element-mobilizing transposase RayT